MDSHQGWVQLNGVWYPSRAEKQQKIFDCAHRYTLIHGPRKTGKSTGIQHKVFRWLVQTENASVGIFSRTTRNGKQGVWKALIGDIYRSWNAMGMTEWVKEPGYEMDTKMAFFRLRNQYGGYSECQLHSINYDENAEELLKDSTFTHIYMVEADRFDRKSFNALQMTLRSASVPYERQQFILDCNPPEEGEDHWLHDVFFKAKGETSMEQWKLLHEQISVSIDENPFLNEIQKQEIYRTYQHDKILLDRYYYGKWVRGLDNSAFSDVFMPNFHIVGEFDANKRESEMELLRPSTGSYVMDVGLDVGDVNTAVSFGCPRIDGHWIAYDIVDEIVYLKDRVTLDELTVEIMAHMDKWDEYFEKILKTKKPQWRFWSDPSSLKFKGAIGGTEAQLMELRSNGRIMMQGVYKAPGTVLKRLDLMKRMLFEERIFFSAKCFRHIEMLRNLRRGLSQTHIIDRGSDYKHVFDSVTYMLQGAMPEEIMAASGPSSAPFSMQSARF